MTYKAEPKHGGLNLVPAIRAVEQQISSKKYLFDKEMAPFYRSLEELRKINEACERCNATGRILRSRACAEDDAPDANDPGDYIDCLECRGSGRSKKEGNNG